MEVVVFFFGCKMGEIKELNEAYLHDLVYHKLVFAAGGYTFGRKMNLGRFTERFGFTMYNIKCKIIAFKPYFEELGIEFPNLDECPGHLLSLPSRMGDDDVITEISEEFIYKNKKIVVKYNHIL